MFIKLQQMTQTRKTAASEGRTQRLNANRTQRWRDVTSDQSHVCRGAADNPIKTQMTSNFHIVSKALSRFLCLQITRSPAGLVPTRHVTTSLTE
jgi:hypothetical protein